MVKPDIVVKFPGFSKNKGENKIEIHKNLTTTEQLNIKAKKGKRTGKSLSKTVKITKKSRVNRKKSTGKKGGDLSSSVKSFFNYTRRAKDAAVKSANDSYTYIFDKVAVINNNVTKMVDGIKVYKNGEYEKDVVLQNNYISNLFTMAKEKFSRKTSSISEKFKSTKTRLIDQIRNATFVVKEDSTFYKYLDMATKNIKDHKRIYAVLAFIIVCTIILFAPFTGVMLFTLIPFAFNYIAAGATVALYDGLGVATAIVSSGAEVISTAGFVTGEVTSVISSYATGTAANLAVAF